MKQNIEKINKHVFNVFMLSIFFLSIFVTTLKAEANSTIQITGLDVTGTEILVSTTTKFEEVTGVNKKREIVVLLFNDIVPSDSIGKKLVENRSETSGIGTVLFGSAFGLKPETNYKVRAYIKETTIRTIGPNLDELIYNPESFVNVKTGKVDQSNFSSAKTDDVVTVNPDKSAPAPNGGVYTLLAPIGDLKTAPDNIGDYFNTIFKIAIGLCGVLAVIMIVIGGVQYMGDESIFGQTEAKGKITSAILGLLIALGSYALLNTINPDLLGKGGVNIKAVTSGIDKIEYISSESFTQITGKKVLSPSEYDTMGRKVAKEVGIPFCAIRVILERESKGNPGAIGFDENVRSTAVPSRTAFINSGKKYNGETFTSSNDLITKEGFVNQSKNDIKNTPGLGVDWRFSKGLGLTQITLFPDGYFTAGYKTNPPSFSTKDTYPTYNGLTPKDLLDPEKNLTAGAKIWKDSWLRCNKDIYGAWVGYGGGPGKCSPSSDFLKKEATTRTEFYNGCPDADKQV